MEPFVESRLLPHLRLPATVDSPPIRGASWMLCGGFVISSRRKEIWSSLNCHSGTEWCCLLIPPSKPPEEACPALRLLHPLRSHPGGVRLFAVVSNLSQIHSDGKIRFHVVPCCGDNFGSDPPPKKKKIILSSAVLLN